MEYFITEYVLGNFIFWIVAGVCVLRLIVAIGKRHHYYTGAYYRCTGKSFGHSNRKDGTRCEEETYEALRHLEKKGYRFLFEAYLPKGNGTSEVDAIVIGPAGIVAIENKDYSGAVIGLEDDKYWSQERPYAQKRNERERWFYNPIMQNAGHIRALKSLVGHSIPIYSMVVFSDRCELSVPSLWQKDVRVTQVNSAAREFEGLVSMSDESVVVDVEGLYNQLKQYIKVSKKVQNQHIEQCKAASVF